MMIPNGPAACALAHGASVGGDDGRREGPEKGEQAVRAEEAGCPTGGQGPDEAGQADEISARDLYRGCSILASNPTAVPRAIHAMMPIADSLPPAK